ncbi:MAG: hypothetical protein HOP20_06240 [Sulfuriferula sp.]|nr:hypothetical protein [Sulfuriferula sp.]
MSTAHYTTANDGRRYQRTILLLTIMLFGLFALAVAGIVPYWLLLLTTPILIVRWMLAVHEIFHICATEQLDWVTRLLPLALTPLFLGYREYRDIHFRHHHYMCTPNDPEYFQLKGGYLSGICNAVTAPEQALYLWLKTHRITPTLAWQFVLHLLLFTSMIYLAGWHFLYYWLPARISYGVSNFSFFYLLHRRGHEYGVYKAHITGIIASLYQLLFGLDALRATQHHDVHHANPRIVAHKLNTTSAPISTHQ